MSNLTAVNNSTSKQLFSFSKAARFPERKSLNNNVAYDRKSEFDKPGEGGLGRPFYQTTTRFNYYASPDKSGKLPGSASYQLGDTFGLNSRKTNEQYSFGVGRDNMKRMFIDDIKKRGDNSLPGPGRYEMVEKFGDQGSKKTMAAKLMTDEQALGRSAKLPGPGSYEFAEVTGKNLTQSHVPTEPKFSFGCAKDRFQVPTRKVASPAPNLYKPANNLNENFNSVFK